LWEDDLKAGKSKVVIKFSRVLERYRDNVSIHKKGRKWEYDRLNKIIRESELAKQNISDITKADIAKWRDKRGLEVSPLSVIREWALLSHVFTTAINDWDLIKTNPMASVQKPKKTPPRDRLPTQQEIDALCYTLNYGDNMDMISSRVGAAMMFAIETALRAQEICNLRWADINGRVAKINDSKTISGVREVPLSTQAMAILDKLKGQDKVFNLTTVQLDSVFRNAKKKALIEDLHFHDLRGEAITRLAKKLDILDLARICGHKDLRMLMVYYREKAETLADKLD
jgi:integrase